MESEIGRSWDNIRCIRSTTPRLQVASSMARQGPIVNLWPFNNNNYTIYTVYGYFKGINQH